MTATMTAIVCHGPEDYRVEQVAKPIGDRKELDVRGAHLGPHCYPVAIDLLTRGKVTSDGIVTHSFDLAEWDHALKVSETPEATKVLLRPHYKAAVE